MKYELNRGNCGLVRRNEYDPFEAFFRPFFREDSLALRTDIREDGDNYRLDADMPGFEKSDINVSVKEGYLTVEARREEREEDKKSFVRKERLSSFSRSFYVGDVDESQITAKYDKGTLSLTFPREAKKAESKHIEIL